MSKRLPRKRLRYGKASFSDPAFRPYVGALGQLALSWNALHETMAFLFCSVMGGGYSNQFLAVWHALKSDRSQRDILLAATESHMNPAYSPQFVSDIKWLCGR